jgi:hypothetical protein
VDSLATATRNNHFNARVTDVPPYRRGMVSWITVTERPGVSGRT